MLQPLVIVKYIVLCPLAIVQAAPAWENRLKMKTTTSFPQYKDYETLDKVVELFVLCIEI